MVLEVVAQELETKTWLEAEQGEQIPLQGVCSIGRQTTNNIILNTLAASRHHALIHEKDGVFWMVHLGGINGVQVNGDNVVQPVRLVSGDRIRMPSAAFVFRQAKVPVTAKAQEKTAPAEKVEEPVSIPELKPVALAPVEQSELPFLTEPLPMVMTRPIQVKAAVTVPVVKPVAKSTETTPKKAEELSKPEKATPVKAESQSKQVAVPLKPAEVVSQKANELSKAVEMVPKKADALPEQTAVPVKPGEVASPKADESSKAVEVAQKKAEALSRQVVEAEVKLLEKVVEESKTSVPIPVINAPTKEFPKVEKVCPMALRSLYVGLASIFLPFVGLLTALAAIVMGHRALRIIRQSEGTLTGQNQAVMGLYFGYVTFAVILVYSTLFVAFFYSSSSIELAIQPAKPLLIPPIFTPVVIKPTVITPAVVAPAAVTPPVEEPPIPFRPAIVARILPAPEPVPAAPVASSADVTSSPVPAEMPTVLAVPNLTPPEIVPSLRNTTTEEMAKAMAAQSTNPAPTNTPALSNPPLSKSNVVESETVVTDDTPQVYSPDLQAKLKAGMLAQPMPLDYTSRPYLDAEAFNNSALILACKPEAKYAESVHDFLEDVKTRNPDRARLQILTAMYRNYMAALASQ